jgi:CBS domain-containing protein
MTAAVDLLVRNKISELPVIDGCGKPVGLIDITDVMAWLPPSDGASELETSVTGSPATVPFPNRS